MSDNQTDSRSRGASSPLPHRGTAQPRTRLGAKLRQDREARGLRQSEVASELGFEQSKLSAYELGKIRIPPRARLMALAALYGHPEDRYTSLLDWSQGSRVVAQASSPGSIVIDQPRPGLARLLELVEQLSDADLAHIIDDTEFLVAQAARREP